MLAPKKILKKNLCPLKFFMFGQKFREAELAFRLQNKSEQFLEWIVCTYHCVRLVSTHNHLTVVVREKTTGGSGGQPAFTGLLRGRGGMGGHRCFSNKPKRKWRSLRGSGLHFFANHSQMFFSIQFSQIQHQNSLGFPNLLQ